LTPSERGGKILAANGIWVLASFLPHEALETPLWPVTALAVGLIVGSFANVCIHRLPLGQSVVTPRSRCPACGAPITARDNIPLLSYALLGGRCRSCRAPISLRYPAVEGANGLLYLGLALQLGPTLHTAVMMAFVTALLVLSLIDLDHYLLPNVITLPGIAVGLAASFLPGPPAPLGSALSAAGGYLVFLAIARIWRGLRDVDALGQGDWKMAAMLGAFLGWQQLLLTVFLASLAGTLTGVSLMVFRGRSSQHRLPFGTFLGFSGIAVVFVGERLVGWYGGLLRG
jgi:leader peptidase (prepilin peptidase)/N-methyltransferase